MKIGTRTFAVADRPGDLDAQLVASTGCNAAEIAGMLAEGAIAGLVANALLPFLAEQDRPAVPELAALIAGEDLAGVTRQVAALYAAPAGGEA
jgi:hypothetical protein